MVAFENIKTLTLFFKEMLRLLKINLRALKLLEIVLKIVFIKRVKAF